MYSKKLRIFSKKDNSAKLKKKKTKAKNKKLKTIQFFPNKYLVAYLLTDKLMFKGALLNQDKEAEAHLQSI